MKKLVFYISILFFLFSSVYAQKSDSLKIDRIKKIYHNLEYNTIAFNDLKNIWDITDPLFVREIFNRMVVANALKVDGKKPSKKYVEQKAKDIYEGKVFVELRRRYYDNEIEVMRFFTESKLDSTKKDSVRNIYFFDPIKDNIQIREILGDKLYNNLKSQFYAFNDLTKTYYDNKDAYDFDINMNITDPELMFLSLTTTYRNKYLFSFVGRWGNDYILIPGWYYPNYIAGVKLTYIDYLINSEPYRTYSFEAGLGFTAHQPEFEFSPLTGGKLYSTGSNLYFKFEGNPLNLIIDNAKNYNFELYTSFAVTQYPATYFKLGYISKFYSTRNYFAIVGHYNNIFNVMDLGWFNASVGITGFDIYNYLYNPKYSNLIDLDPDKPKFKYNLNFEASLSNAPGLLQYKAAFQWNINVNDGYTYFGVKTRIMLGNTIGFDFKFYSGYALSGNLPYYRQKSYLVFSPIIRINY